MLTAHDIARRRATVIAMLRFGALASLLMGIQLFQERMFYNIYYYSAYSSGPGYLIRGLRPMWWWTGLFAFLWWLGPWLAARIVPASSATLCPRCGFDIAGTSELCNECGLTLAAPSSGHRRMPLRVFRTRLCEALTAILRVFGLLFTLGFATWFVFLAVMDLNNPIQMILRYYEENLSLTHSTALILAYVIWPSVGALLFFKARWISRLLVFGSRIGWPRRRADHAIASRTRARLPLR